MADIRGIVKTYKKNMNNKAFVRTINYTKFFEKEKVQDNVILYESFHGKGMTDNPFALFKFLYSNESYKNYKHIWVLNETENNKYYEFYKKDKRVKFIKTHSKEYYYYLSVSKFLINSVSFPPYFVKKDNQVYINTWHGTPLKTIGKDMEGAVSQHSNVQRNFLQSDYIISPNGFTTDKLSESHNINGIYEGEILENGYPRIDSTFHPSSLTEQILIQDYDIDLTKKIILYAPTWRGNNKKISDTVESIITDMMRLAKEFRDQEYEILLKVHPLVYKYAKQYEGLPFTLVPNWIDTNELLGFTDILITDYSSIFFDFLVTGKPILFYMYDKNEYMADRGVYMSLDHLPGPTCYNVQDIINNISNISSVGLQYKEIYQEFKENYANYDDGKVTSKYVDYIFETLPSVKVVKKTDEKMNILVYAGAFQNNGITTSIINLSNNLNYDKYNLIIIDKKNGNNIFKNNIEKLSSQVKVLFREGSTNYTYKDWIDYSRFLRTATIKNDKVHNKITDRELNRLIGNVKVDIAIDFSGYVPFWSYVFAMSSINHKVIYQHNDMLAEFNKIVNGKKVHEKKLDKIFALYKYFDKIVSVGKKTMELNETNLTEFVSKNKFSYVPNALDIKKLFQHRDEPMMKKAKIGNKEYLLLENEDKFGFLQLKGISNLEEDGINFINIGRLSPEKDQSKLLRAYKKARSGMEKPSKLYIVGSGVLDGQLKKEAEELDIQDYVVFTGQIETTYELLDKCDCFVFSSNHEGQPMTLLESLSLNKPVIATDIPGNRSVLGNEFGYIIPNNENSLADAMISYSKEKWENRERFDYVRYNNNALEKFYEVVCNVTK